MMVSPTTDSERPHSNARSFVPPNGIIVPVTLAPELMALLRQHLPTAMSEQDLLRSVGAPANRFAVFSSDFINLQLATVRALNLPIAQEGFKERYGEFYNAKPIQDCVAGLRALHLHCQKFGNPAKLVAEISQLGAGDKPATLYGQIVWLAQQITNTSRSFSITLESVLEILGNASSKEKRHRILTRLLTGEGGMVAEAQKMATEAQTLRTALLAYLAEMKQIQAPIDEYFSHKSDLYQEAQTEVAHLSEEITRAQDDLDKFRTLYIVTVGGAVFVGLAAGVGIFALAMGIIVPFSIPALILASAIASTIGLSVAAERTRSDTNRTEEKLSQLSAEKRKKAQLVTDINGLNLGIGPVESYLTAVSQSLGAVAEVWQNVATALTSIVTDTTPDALMDLTAFEQLTRIGEGRDKWAETALATQQFTSDAFVQFQGAL